MKLIVITRPDFFPNEASNIISLFDQGLEILHLRKPDSTRDEVERLLNEIPKHYHSRIVLHDHFELTTLYGVRGVHLNRRNSSLPEGFAGSVSRSCHSLTEVEEYKEQCDYLFLSPVYDSISKECYGAAFSKDVLHEAGGRGIIDRRVMALGGVSADCFDEIVSFGFGGAVLLGDVWQQTTENFISHFKELLNIADTTFGKHSLPPVVLTIAGSDSSGGAGVQADIKTISALGGYAASVITAVTAQNTLGVTAIHAVPHKMIEQQIVAVMDDLSVGAIKTGMLHDVDALECVVGMLERYRPQYVVCDPVMVATSGSHLMARGVAQVMKEQLFPLSTIITPNLHEVEVLLGRHVDGREQMRQAARELSESCHTAVLVKGGHLSGECMCDVLYDGSDFHEYMAERVDSQNLHGTGCSLSSAIATYLVRGLSLPDAVGAAKRYVTRAIVLARGMSVGQGHGPLWHQVRY